MGLPNGQQIEYKGTFDLSSAAGQLISTLSKMNPARTGTYTPAVSPKRRLRAVTVTFSVAATQTVKVSIVDVDGVARPIATLDVVAATDFYFEPEHDISIRPKENYQVDVTATGAPAVTGTIVIFTEEM